MYHFAKINCFNVGTILFRSVKIILFNVGKIFLENLRSGSSINLICAIFAKRRLFNLSFLPKQRDLNWRRWSKEVQLQTIEWHTAKRWQWPLQLFILIALQNLRRHMSSVWPDWAIYWTLEIFLKHLATINLPKSPYILRHFLQMCQNLSSLYWNLFWATFIDIWRFFSGHTACHVSKIV